LTASILVTGASGFLVHAHVPPSGWGLVDDGIDALIGPTRRTRLEEGLDRMIASPRARSERRASLRLDVGGLDDLLGNLELVAHEPAEIGRAHRHCFGAEA
jgi:hypothetical protein